MKINIKALHIKPSDILLPVALIALCAGLMWWAGSSLHAHSNNYAHTTIANASLWETTSGEVLSITTLPGKTSYQKSRAVQSWYANAEVTVNDETVIVRLPDDTLVIEGSTLPLWLSTKTGEVRAVAPVSDLEIRDAQKALASAPVDAYVLGGLIGIPGIVIISLVVAVAKDNRQERRRRAGAYSR